MPLRPRTIISPAHDLGCALVGGLALAAAGTVMARDAAPMQPGGDTAGLAVLVAPACAGSDEYRGRVLPQFDLRRRNGVFLGASEGLGYRLNAGFIAYGVQVTPDRGRRERDAEALRGLGDVKARPEFGVFAQAPLADNGAASVSLRYGYLHVRAQQFFFVLTGPGTLEFGDGRVTPRPGEGAHLPPGVAHRFANHAEQPAEFPVISSPAVGSDRVPADRDA